MNSGANEKKDQNDSLSGLYQIAEDPRGGVLELKRILKRGLDLSARDGEGLTPLLFFLRRVKRNQISFWSYAGRSAITAVEYTVERGLFSRFKNGAKTTFPLSQQRECAAQPWGPAGQLVYISLIDCALLLISQRQNLEAADDQGNTPLLCAAAIGEMRLVRALITNGARLDAKNKAGENIIHLCAASGRADALAAILKIENIPGVNETDAAGWSALHHLAASGDFTESAKLLLRRRGDISIKSAAMKRGFSAGKTAAQIAAAKGFDGCAALLSPKAQKAHPAGIHEAAGAGDIGRIERYLRAGGDIEAIDGDGCTPLLRAAVNNRREVIKLLTVNGADINAAQSQHFNALMLCLDRLHDRNTLRGDFERECTSAALTAEVLIDGGIDLRAAKKFSGQTALHDAAGVSGEITAMIVRALRASYADYKSLIDCRDREGLTALHLAARGGNLRSLRALCEAGADINAADECGCTPLHAAILAGESEAAQYLIEHGADTACAIVRALGICAAGDDARAIAVKAKRSSIVRMIDSCTR